MAAGQHLPHLGRYRHRLALPCKGVCIGIRIAVGHAFVRLSAQKLPKHILWVCLLIQRRLWVGSGFALCVRAAFEGALQKFDGRDRASTCRSKVRNGRLEMRLQFGCLNLELVETLRNTLVSRVTDKAVEQVAATNGCSEVEGGCLCGCYSW